MIHKDCFLIMGREWIFIKCLYLPLLYTADIPSWILKCCQMIFEMHCKSTIYLTAGDKTIFKKETWNYRIQNRPLYKIYLTCTPPNSYIRSISRLETRISNSPLVKKKLQIITLTNCQIYTSLVVKAEPSGNPTTSCSASGQSFSMIFRNKHTTSLPFCVSLPLDLSILTAFLIIA